MSDEIRFRHSGIRVVIRYQRIDGNILRLHVSMVDSVVEDSVTKILHRGRITHGGIVSTGPLSFLYSEIGRNPWDVDETEWMLSENALNTRTESPDRGYGRRRECVLLSLCSVRAPGLIVTTYIIISHRIVMLISRIK